MLQRAVLRRPSPAGLFRQLSSTSTRSNPTPPNPTQTPTDPRFKLRTVILTGSVALITVVGAITGARLKSDNETVQKQQDYIELSLDERIAELEKRRLSLMAAKRPLERKLETLRGRMAKDEDGAKEENV